MSWARRGQQAFQRPGPPGCARRLAHRAIERQVLRRTRQRQQVRGEQRQLARQVPGLERLGEARLTRFARAFPQQMRAQACGHLGLAGCAEIKHARRHGRELEMGRFVHGLLQQGRLADAGVAAHQHRPAIAVAGRHHQRAQLCQLRAASDHPARGRCGVGFRLDDRVRRQRADPLQRQCGQRTTRHQPGDRGGDLLIDPGLARRRRFHQARRQRRRIAGDGIGRVAGAAEMPCEHLAQRDTDMRAEALAGLARQLRQALMDRDRRAGGAQGIVAMGGRCAEQRHDRIAHVLVDRAPVLQHDRIDRLEIARQHAMGLLGIAPG
jgi:hypothetical protein